MKSAELRRSTQTTDARPYVMSYSYDLAGNLKSQTYPSNRVVGTTYDAADRVATVSAGTKVYASLTTATAYAPHGAIAEMKLGNNL